MTICYIRVEGRIISDGTHKRCPHLLLTTSFCCVKLLAASSAPLHSAQTFSSSIVSAVLDT